METNSLQAEKATFAVCVYFRVTAAGLGWGWSVEVTFKIPIQPSSNYTSFQRELQLSKVTSHLRSWILGCSLYVCVIYQPNEHSAGK